MTHNNLPLLQYLRDAAHRGGAQLLVTNTAGEPLYETSGTCDLAYHR